MLVSFSSLSMQVLDKAPLVILLARIFFNFLRGFWTSRQTCAGAYSVGENGSEDIKKPAFAGFEFYGGNVCESNTPKTFCAPRNGFEGRGPHQGSIRLRNVDIIA